MLALLAGLELLSLVLSFVSPYDAARRKPFNDRRPEVRLRMVMGKLFTRSRFATAVKWASGSGLKSVVGGFAVAFSLGLL